MLLPENRSPKGSASRRSKVKACCEGSITGVRSNASSYKAAAATAPSVAAFGLLRRLGWLPSEQLHARRAAPRSGQPHDGCRRWPNESATPQSDRVPHVVSQVR
eukprot:6731452-Prymnesium_polylepis.1